MQCKAMQGTSIASRVNGHIIGLLASGNRSTVVIVCWVHACMCMDKHVLGKHSQLDVCDWTGD